MTIQVDSKMTEEQKAELTRLILRVEVWSIRFHTSAFNSCAERGAQEGLNEARRDIHAFVERLINV